MFHTLMQATQPVVEQVVIHRAEQSTGQEWQGILITAAGVMLTALTSVVTIYLVPYLKWRAKQFEASAGSSASAGAVSDQQAKSILAERVKAMAAGVALSLAERKYPELAARIAAGQMTTAAEVKDELRSWGDTLKATLVAAVDQQGGDVLAELGETWLNGVIERAADSASPFPGRDSAKALLEGGAAAILQAGVDYVRQLNAVSPPGASPLPPAAQNAVASATAARSNPLKPA